MEGSVFIVLIILIIVAVGLWYYKSSKASSGWSTQSVEWMEGDAHGDGTKDSPFVVDILDGSYLLESSDMAFSTKPNTEEPYKDKHVATYSFGDDKKIYVYQQTSHTSHTKAVATLVDGQNVKIRPLTSDNQFANFQSVDTTLFKLWISDSLVVKAISKSRLLVWTK